VTKQKVISNSADKVLREIEDLSEKKFLPIIGPNRGKFLVDEVKKAKPRRILEVGTLVGYSAILMGKELDETSEITTIEIHRDEAEVASENILRAKIRPKVQVIAGDATKVIPALNGTFSFAFIDAEKTEYFQYLKLAEGKLLASSTVVADNAGIFANQMRDYLDYVRNSGKYQSRFIQVGDDGLEISLKT